MLQCSWEGHDNSHQGDDNAENDCTEGVIREGVKDLGTSKDVESNQHNVVGEQHETGEFICNLALSANVVSEVADIPDLGVLHDEFVHGDGGDPEEDARTDHGDYARNPS